MANKLKMFMAWHLPEKAYWPCVNSGNPISTTAARLLLMPSYKSWPKHRVWHRIQSY